MASLIPQASFPIEGGCVCKLVRYKMLTPPLITNCCHCTWCQRETGTAFALNAMIEADRVIQINPKPLLVIPTPTHSGQGQQITRCPECYVVVWSDFGTRDLVRYVRVGTLDQPELCPPEVHLFTENKQPWLIIPPNEGKIPVFEQNYRKEDVWSKDSLGRLEAATRNLKKDG